MQGREERRGERGEGGGEVGGTGLGEGEGRANGEGGGEGRGWGRGESALVVTVVVVAGAAGVLRCTTLEAASTSSITKMIFLKERGTAISASSSLLDLAVLTHRTAPRKE